MIEGTCPEPDTISDVTSRRLRREPCLMPLVPVEASETTPILARRTLADCVYVDLRERLVSGQLAPGDRLSLREISSNVGVSVMPVREAVNRLVAERALEITTKRVLRVPLSSPEQIRDLADIRATIEGYAAERAALARTAAQLQAIEAAEATLRINARGAAPDPGVLIGMNQALHFAIYEAAGLPLLFKIIGDLWLKAGPMLNLDIRTNAEQLWSGVVVEYHAAAVSAIRARDGAAARAAIAEDIKSAAAFIIAQCDRADS